MKTNKAAKKSSGLERHLDDLGRIVIPKEMRNKLNFEKNEKLSISLFENHIEIRKSEIRCLFCNTKENLDTYKNYSFCKSCLDNMVNDLNKK